MDRIGPGPERAQRSWERARVSYVLDAEKRALDRPVYRFRDLAAEMDPAGRDPAENLYRALKPGVEKRDQGAGRTPTRQGFDRLFEEAVKKGNGVAGLGAQGVRFLEITRAFNPDLYASQVSREDELEIRRTGARPFLAESSAGARGSFGEVAAGRAVSVEPAQGGMARIYTVVDSDGHEQSTKYGVAFVLMKLL